MRTAVPLGALAEVILERHGEQIEAELDKAAARSKPRSFGLGPARSIDPTVIRFTIGQLAAQHIQPGNWVAVGRIQDASGITTVEFNLSSWESREVSQPLDLRHDIGQPPVGPSVTSPVLSQAAS
ncbi:MAG: hypothetical protein ACJ789_06595 [Thermomicrobiales bacterium]